VPGVNGTSQAAGVSATRGLYEMTVRREVAAANDNLELLAGGRAAGLTFSADGATVTGASSPTATRAHSVGPALEFGRVYPSTGCKPSALCLSTCFGTSLQLPPIGVRLDVAAAGRPCWRTPQNAPRV